MPLAPAAGALGPPLAPRRLSPCARRPVRRACRASAASVTELDVLREMSKIVVDSCDLGVLQAGVSKTTPSLLRHPPTVQWRPSDATTNHTLLAKAVADDGQYAQLPLAAVRRHGGTMADTLAVAVGMCIMGLVPGRVSTEVDARFAHDADAQASHGLRLAELYLRAGVPISRVLVQLPATAAGVVAVERLRRAGVACNATLVFSAAQAVACADAGAALVSVCAGPVLDWEAARAPPGTDLSGPRDPGVALVRRVFHALRAHGYDTQVMAASFRGLDQVRGVAGCDAVALSPALLDALAASSLPLARRLSAHDSAAAPPPPPAAAPAGSEAALGSAMDREDGGRAAALLAAGVDGFARDAAALDD